MRVRFRHEQPLPDAGLMAHLRARVWGPAEFMGLPPWRLVGQGVLVGLLGAGGIVGAGALGMWSGPPALASGEAGIAVACVLALYLLAVQAGRAFVGLVLVLGVCLALATPRATAGLVLAERGQVQQALVTAVQSEPGGGRGQGRHLCSVESVETRGGAPLRARIWRGCRPSTEPGDALAVVYDPLGRVAPRGMGGAKADPTALLHLAGLATGLVAGCVVATVRSFRLGAVQT